MSFECISSIDISNHRSWDQSIFLTFDVDWASEFVLEDTFSLLENINYTVFVTHESKFLKQLSRNHNVELGIHPNFNPLLSGDFRYGDTAEKVVDTYIDMVDSATAVRSHSMTQSSQILNIFEKKGLRYDCNTFVPYYSNSLVKPWYWVDKSLIKVPYFWEDDVQFIFDSTWNINLKNMLMYNGIKVFDFHPIHVFLNTENIERYQAAKPYQNDYNQLKKYVNKDSFGTRDFLVSLIKQGKLKEGIL